MRRRADVFRVKVALIPTELRARKDFKTIGRFIKECQCGWGLAIGDWGSSSLPDFFV
jgi:hypothetical protein